MKKFKIRMYPVTLTNPAPLFHVHIRAAFPKNFFAKLSIYVGHKFNTV